MPQTVTITASDDGSTVAVDAGDLVRVDLGPAWHEPRLRPLGGEPGPTMTPLRVERSIRHEDPAPGGVVELRAVSAGRVAVRAAPSDAGEQRFEIAVVVRPRPGTKAPGRSS